MASWRAAAGEVVIGVLETPAVQRVVVSPRRPSDSGGPRREPLRPPAAREATPGTQANVAVLELQLAEARARVRLHAKRLSSSMLTAMEAEASRLHAQLLTAQIEQTKREIRAQQFQAPSPAPSQPSSTALGQLPDPTRCPATVTDRASASAAGPALHPEPSPAPRVTVYADDVVRWCPAPKLADLYFVPNWDPPDEELASQPDALDEEMGTSPPRADPWFEVFPLRLRLGAPLGAEGAQASAGTPGCGEPGAPADAQPGSLPGAQPDALPSCQPGAPADARPSALPSGQPGALPRCTTAAPTDARPNALPGCQPGVQPGCEPDALPSYQQPGAPADAQPSALPGWEHGAPGDAQPDALLGCQPGAPADARPSALPGYQPGALRGCSPGAPADAQPSTLPCGVAGALLGCLPSDQPGAPADAQLGALPGCEHGAPADAQPGALPGAQPSALPGCQPSARSDAQPDALPCCQPGAPADRPSALPGYQPGALRGGAPGAPADAQPSTLPCSEAGALPGLPACSISDALPGDQQPGAPADAQLGAQPGCEHGAPADAHQAGALPGAQPGALPGCQPSAPGDAQPRALLGCQLSTPADARPSALPGYQPGALRGCTPGALADVQPGTLPCGEAGALLGCLPSDAQPGCKPDAVPSYQQSGAPADAQLGALPGCEPGAPADAQPGALPGAQPSALPGCQPSASGDAQPDALLGCQPGAPADRPSALPGYQPGALHGCTPGAPADAQPATLPGALPGCEPSAPADAQPGALPGCAAGAQPSALPGWEAGAPPGCQRGASASALPVARPGAGPRAQAVASYTSASSGPSGPSRSQQQCSAEYLAVLANIRTWNEGGVEARTILERLDHGAERLQRRGTAAAPSMRRVLSVIGALRSFHEAQFVIAGRSVGIFVVGGAGMAFILPVRVPVRGASSPAVGVFTCAVQCFSLVARRLRWRGGRGIYPGRMPWLKRADPAGFLVPALASREIGKAWQPQRPTGGQHNQARANSSRRSAPSRVRPGAEPSPWELLGPLWCCVAQYGSVGQCGALLQANGWICEVFGEDAVWRFHAVAAGFVRPAGAVAAPAGPPPLDQVPQAVDWRRLLRANLVARQKPWVWVHLDGSFVRVPLPLARPLSLKALVSLVADVARAEQAPSPADPPGRHQRGSDEHPAAAVHAERLPPGSANPEHLGGRLERPGQRRRSAGGRQRPRGVAVVAEE
ncbi:unnamed protein product, partial [Prorocentrum cordatum]